MRAFFALKPAAERCLAIERWRQLNWPLLPGPVPVANFHITLAFLGEIDSRRLERLTGRARELRLPGFELELDCLGYWPKPGILWLGPRRWPDSLASLAGALAAAGAAARLKMDRRRYRPHLTLARRLRRPPPAALEPPRLRCDFDSFALYESGGGPRGVVYREVARWPLAERARKARLAGG